MTLGHTILFIKLEEMLPLWGKSGPYVVEEPRKASRSLGPGPCRIPEANGGAACEEPTEAHPSRE